MSEEKEKEKEKLGPFRNPCSIEITLGCQKSHSVLLCVFLGLTFWKLTFILQFVTVHLSLIFGVWPVLFLFHSCFWLSSSWLCLDVYIHQWLTLVHPGYFTNSNLERELIERWTGLHHYEVLWRFSGRQDGASSRQQASSWRCLEVTFSLTSISSFTCLLTRCWSSDVPKTRR